MLASPGIVMCDENWLHPLAETVSCAHGAHGAHVDGEPKTNGYGVFSMLITDAVYGQNDIARNHLLRAIMTARPGID